MIHASSLARIAAIALLYAPTSRLVSADRSRRLGEIAAHSHGGSEDALPYNHPTSSGYCRKEKTSCEYKSLKHEFIYKEGLGENLGLPGISFLGVGYNIFEGNPRGSENSEVDPGFRYPVFKLRSDQSRVTADQVWLIPYGVATSAGFSCKFSSQSTEISNEQEYQRQLSNEAKLKITAGVSGAGVIKGVPFEASAKFAYTKSQKFNSFSKSLELMQTVSYEAKAQCTEREIYFKPFSKQVLDESVVEGMHTLPYPGTFDETNQEHLDLYARFIDAFGTHVVTRVTLGGKHIISTELDSRDVMELKRQKVSISESLSFETSLSIGNKTSQETLDTAEKKKKLISGSSDDKFDVLVYNLPDGKLPENSPATKPENPASSKSLGFSASFGIDTTRSEETSTEQLSRIKSKVRARNEIIIGGTPPEDGNWRAWAASVRERPMPIQYELEGLWNYMEKDAEDDFVKAFFFIYGINLRFGEETNEVLQQMHFGVFDMKGVPVTSYSSSSSSNYRSIVHAEQFTSNRVRDAFVDLFVGESKISRGISNIKTCPIGYFACGVKIRYDTDATGYWEDGEGIFELSMRCCNSYDWKDHRDVVIQGVDPDRRAQAHSYVSAEKTCEENTFITGGSVRYSDESRGDAFGICGLKIICTAPIDPSDPGKGVDIDETLTVLDSINPEVERKTFQEEIIGQTKGEKSKIHQSLGDFKFPTVMGMGVNYVSTNYRWWGKGIEAVGIDGLRFQFREKKTDDGFQNDVYQYTYVWEGSQAFVSTFMASIIRNDISPNKQEDFDELGISRDMIESGTFPYGLISTKDPQQARILASSFANDLLTTDLNSLSLLAVDNNPLVDITAGVIHPLGYIVNSKFGKQSGFKIEKDDDQTFIVRFTKVSTAFQPNIPGESDTTTGTTTPSEAPSGLPTSIEGEKMPTFLVFPIWFSTTSLPRHAGEVVVATKEKCTIDSCIVSVGTSDSSTKELGFAFVSLKHTVENPGVVHGTINLYFNNKTETWEAEKLSGRGFTVSGRSGYDCPNRTEIIVEDVDKRCNFPTENNLNDLNRTVTRGGVEILFDEEFPYLPTVVVSPILNNPDHKPKPIINTMSYLRNVDKPDAFSLPSAIVENISVDKTVIKAGWVNERESCPGTLQARELDRCIRRNQDRDFCDEERDNATSYNRMDATQANLAKKIEDDFADCLKEAAIQAEGEKITTFEPLSFSFFAVGPPPRP